MNDILKELYFKHEALRNNSINLLPSENQLSSLAKAFLMGDMGNRYYFSNPYSGNGIKYSYNGTEFIENILEIGINLAKEVFDTKFVSFYPISGHNANLTLLLKYCKPGDDILVYDPAYGGYPGLDKEKLPKLLGLNVHYFPVQSQITEMIDLEKSISVIKKVKPKVIIYSLAHTIFPIPLVELTEISKKVNSIFIYDGSHPLGLISGGLFQKPFKDGADFLVGGTQKSFPGPQGGIIMSNYEQTDEFEHFNTVDNPHFNRIAATVVTIAEMKEFGYSYAQSVINNTKYFASKLFEKGFNVLYSESDFTESHMFKIKTDAKYFSFVDKLKSADIFLDYSGRIGCGEMTRYGMRKEEFDFISNLFSEIEKSNDASNFKEVVHKFRGNFKQTYYCYNVD